jgi:hypothetical protein
MMEFREAKIRFQCLHKKEMFRNEGREGSGESKDSTVEKVR